MIEPCDNPACVTVRNNFRQTATYLERARARLREIDSYIDLQRSQLRGLVYGTLKLKRTKLDSRDLDVIYRYIVRLRRQIRKLKGR